MNAAAEREPAFSLWWPKRGIASPARPWHYRRMPDYSLFGDERVRHVRQYEATGGKVGHDWNDAHCLILHTTGRMDDERLKLA
jgi:hypothetical protein